MFVLIENDSVAGVSPLGIFDHPNIGKKLLSEYYGEFKEISHENIEDSGLEWQKTIMCDGEKIILTLYEFSLNEIA